MKLIRKSDQKDGWYSVDPKSAAELLENRSKNRPLSEPRAKRIADDITEGKYQANGEPLIFSPSGRLLDGQHRLRAILISGRSIETYVVHGVPDQAFDTMDTGKSRAGADIAAIAGRSNYAIVASVAAWAIKHETGTWRSMIKGQIRNWQIDDWLRKNGAEVEQRIEELRHGADGFAKLGSPASLVFVYMMAYREDPDAALRFMSGLASGTGLSSGSPVLFLRNRMLTERLDGHHRMALCILAWKAFRDGRKVGVLRWKSTKSGSGGTPMPMFGDEE